MDEEFSYSSEFNEVSICLQQHLKFVLHIIFPELCIHLYIFWIRAWEKLLCDSNSNPHPIPLHSNQFYIQKQKAIKSQWNENHIRIDCTMKIMMILMTKYKMKAFT